MNMVTCTTTVEFHCPALRYSIMLGYAEGKHELLGAGLQEGKEGRYIGQYFPALCLSIITRSLARHCVMVFFGARAHFEIHVSSLTQVDREPWQGTKITLALVSLQRTQKRHKVPLIPLACLPD
eukprot:c15158_g1_i1 orf=1570-1941(+)